MTGSRIDRPSVQAQLGQNLLSRERVSESVKVEVFHHLICDDDGILRLPRLRPVFQNMKLNR